MPLFMSRNYVKHIILGIEHTLRDTEFIVSCHGDKITKTNKSQRQTK